MTYWVTNTLLAFLGIGLLSFLARFLFYNKIKIRSISKTAKQHLGFLLKTGYKITKVSYIAHHYGGWHIELESQDHRVSLMLDEEQGLLISFGHENREQERQISLPALIYHLTNEQVLVGHNDDKYTLRMDQQFEWVASMIKKYQDQITGFSRMKPLELEKVLKKARSKYAASVFSLQREQARKTKRQVSR